MSQLLDSMKLPDALLQAERLPSPPGVAVEVLRLCKEEETTLSDLADVLSKDPVLSVRLLRFANSSLYNLGQEVTTIQRACLVLGMKTVQLMSLSFSLAESVPSGNQVSESGFNYPEFWRRSLVCAVAGRTLASVAGLMSEDEAFLCGLLSHFGQIVIAECLPEEFVGILEATEGSWPSVQLENERLGFDRSDVGAALLESWTLPQIIVAAVGAMYDPTKLNASADMEVVNVVRVMNLAALTVELLTCEDKGETLSTIEDRAMAWFELPPDVIYTYITSLEDGIKEASQLLNVDLPVGDSHAKILDDARQQLVSLSVSTARQLENTRGSIDLQHRHKILEDPALRDKVTGVPNDAAFNRFFDQELLARIEGPLKRPLGLLLIELDDFREFEAVFGATAGNEILRACGLTLNAMVRKGDLPARLSESRFAVIMSEGTPFGLRALAERLRHGIADLTVQLDGKALTVTATCAGACIGEVLRARDGKALIAASEKLLKRAQAADRDHVQVHPTLLGKREQG